MAYQTAGFSLTLSPDVFQVCRAITEELLRLDSPSPEDVNRVKVRVCQRFSAARIPSNSEIIACLTEEERSKLLPVLRRKRTRTLSGVTVIAVMSKPYPCPKPSPCIYCPGGPPRSPQSYTGKEPAAMRGAQHNYDPYEQVVSRIAQLRAIGHEVDKVELILMGGTFPATPEEYQRWFVKGCLDALIGRKTSSLEEAKKLAETAPMRNSGITVETRPDWCRERDVDRMLELGVTRVEVGVQTIYDDIYELVERGHSVEDVEKATQVLKDAGLKVCYHMMPGLPGSSFERDLAAFRAIFQEDRFKPDMLKIYPCLVIEGTKLYEMYLRGEYKPLETEEAVELIAEAKKLVPPWVRIMRVMRDIPAHEIVAGVKASNLRELVLKRLREMGHRCRCIRCREVGLVELKEGYRPSRDNVENRVIWESSCGGSDIFISVEDVERDVMIAYLRLRIPSEKAHRPEVVEKPSAIVRELHVYGQMVPVGSSSPTSWQHAGLGELLLKEAERIAKEEFDAKKILVTSGLGVKPYYYRLGYSPDGPYVSKPLM